jgi:hypothetical protein
MKLMYGNVLGSRTTTSAPVIRLLQHMSAKQGAAMDAPGSVKKIPVGSRDLFLLPSTPAVRSNPCTVWFGVAVAGVHQDPQPQHRGAA